MTDQVERNYDHPLVGKVVFDGKNYGIVEFLAPDLHNVVIRYISGIQGLICVEPSCDNYEGLILAQYYVE